MFEKIFEPFYIGRVEVPNRLVMSSMVVGYAGIRGEVTDQLIAYYEARARGGVGLIITEAVTDLMVSLNIYEYL
jgi:2,4-dienoyl-CoA reductase-like NADH-dependent reductase (Old Yellow Enzyme family)